MKKHINIHLTSIFFTLTSISKKHINIHLTQNFHIGIKIRHFLQEFAERRKNKRRKSYPAASPRNETTNRLR